MGGIQWWCSARGVAWTWTWQAYPGIWLFVAAVAWLLWRAREHREPVRRARVASGIAAVILLWLSLDWPTGPLGTGYLASVHAAQFILLALVIPPLALVALDRERIAAAVDDNGLLRRMDAFFMHPVVAGAGFTIIMAVTHVPLVVDAMMPLQLGAMALDLSWGLAGVWLWWPMLVSSPARPWFQPPLRMLYLFLATQAHLLIAMWLLRADFPVYATYELAPRVTPFSALADQQMAGALMIGAAEPIVLGAITIVFFKWAARFEHANR